MKYTCKFPNVPYRVLIDGDTIMEGDMFNYRMPISEVNDYWSKFTMSVGKPILELDDTWVAIRLI